MDIVLHTYGARVRMAHGLYKITVPDATGGGQHLEEAFAPHEVSAILLQPGTSASADVFVQALRDDVDIVILDHHGNVLGRLLSTRPSTTLNIWHNQLLVSRTPHALRFAREWLLQKARQKIAFLRRLKPYRDAEKQALIERTEAAIVDLYARIGRLTLNDEQLDCETAAAALRGFEGRAQRIYWTTLSRLLPSEYQFRGRSRRPAQDLFNAYLNYGYGILYRLVEGALWRAGIHPYIGFHHVDDYQRKSMVFDFIEPYRVWVDELVFKLFSAKIPQRGHARTLDSGGLWLQKQGLKLLQTEFAERMEEERFTHDDGKTYSLRSLMRLHAQAFAAQLNRWGQETGKAAYTFLVGMLLSCSVFFMQKSKNRPGCTTASLTISAAIGCAGAS